MRDERPRGGTARDGLHYGRLHFHIAPFGEEIANLANDRTALQKRITHLIVGN